ncbi:hypothetical protein [Chryseobacterium oryctis]|uniref:Lipoprotein n=1 Tax=Chryseobacterium oryctis TaxID=2952618 RepID=A0ABT3HMW9_9FLAO|nr:hypothetical protein [Chryseobacterium oryctis]MCW3161130.1 hypothetical protein [Chryseobacterium oryctis]
MGYKVFIYFFIVSISLGSCFPAYNVSSKEYRNVKADFLKKKVFVTNKELKKEYEILRHSKIYEITNDTAYVTRIKLYHMKISTPYCGNPIIGTVITAGLLPSYFPYNSSYSYDLIENNTTTHHQYHIGVNQSFWLFNIFRLGKTFKRQSGKALLGSYVASNK